MTPEELDAIEARSKPVSEHEYSQLASDYMIDVPKLVARVRDLEVRLAAVNEARLALGSSPTLEQFFACTLKLRQALEGSA